MKKRSKALTTSRSKKKRITEADRLKELTALRRVGVIAWLILQPKFILRDENKKPIARYTPDFLYALRKPMWGLQPGWYIEEHKESKKSQSYTKRDYPIFRRWLMSIKPKFTFIENINGVIEFPKVVYPREK